jgi:hypoxanthine phosphoribosyltransferase
MRQLAVGRDDISSTVQALAKRINQDYRGKSVVFIGVLNGVFMFFTDLMKQINLGEGIEIDFIAVKSYHENERTEGFVLLKEVNIDITNKIVIVVDDILDSGKTKKFITHLLLEKKPVEIKWCFLLQKGFEKIVDDYIGISINPDWFVYGYGLDDNGKCRQLIDIYYND